MTAVPKNSAGNLRLSPGRKKLNRILCNWQLYLFLLPALLFGGWVILAVIGGLIGAVFMILGSVFGGLATAAEAVFSGLSSTGGIALGAVIGFLLYRRLKRKNAEKASEAEEAADETNESDSYFTSVNSWKNGNS